MSENYGTLQGFKDYQSGRGNSTIIVDLEDSQIETALLIASEWLDNTYRNVWPGEKFGQRGQVRDWPRSDAFDFNKDPVDYKTVPIEVERATYEAALRHILNPGSLSVDWTPNRYNRVSVDGAISVQYRNFIQASEVQTRYAIIDQMLSVLISGQGNVSDLSGRVTRV